MFTGRKGHNARCRDTRFRDSSGVPHDPDEYGTAVGEDGEAHYLPAARDAAKRLGPGAYTVTWRSGITTDVIITESGSVADGTARRKVIDRPQTVPAEPEYVPADQVGGRTEPLGDPPVPFHHISRSLRKKVDKALGDRAAHLAQEARKARAEAIKAVRRAAGKSDQLHAVDAGLANALPRLSDQGLRAALLEVQRRVDAHAARVWWHEPKKWEWETHRLEVEFDTALRDAYEAETYARTLSRRARQTRNHDVWPQVWEAVVAGASDREIAEAISTGADLDALAWVTAGVQPHRDDGVPAWEDHSDDPAESSSRDGTDDVADGLILNPNLGTFTRAEVVELARRSHWPPFSLEDTELLMRTNMRQFDAALWWRVGARNARQIDQLMRLGLAAPTAMAYAKAGAVTFGDMAALARDRVPVEQASDYLRRRYTTTTASS